MKPDYDGLRIDPCIPADWREYRVRRTFRGAPFDIRIRNPEGVHKGVKTLSIDGARLGGNLIETWTPGAVHRVDVVLGLAARAQTA